MIHICWYQGQGHLQRSKSDIKFRFLKKVAVLGAIVFHRHILFCVCARKTGPYLFNFHRWTKYIAKMCILKFGHGSLRSLTYCPLMKFLHVAPGLYTVTGSNCFARSCRRVFITCSGSYSLHFCHQVSVKKNRCCEEKDIYSRFFFPISEANGCDFTCLVASVAQILLDPYYRTQKGFQALIQKEWVRMGHPFQEYLCLLSSSNNEQVI